MAITLHVDLDQTDMYDFIEHFERSLHDNIASFVDDAYVPSLVHHNPWVVWDSEPLNKPESPDYPAIRISRQPVGSTKQIYMISRERDPETKSRSKAWPILFMLTLVRYRRDRLKLALVEFGEEDVYAQKMAAWLEPRWGTAIKEHPWVDAPQGGNEIQVIIDSWRDGLNSTHQNIFDRWREGMTAPDIAQLTNMGALAINNLVSDWRSKLTAAYGKDVTTRILPYRKAQS